MPPTAVRRAGLAAATLLLALPVAHGARTGLDDAATVQVRDSARAVTDVTRIAQGADEVVVAGVEAVTGHGTSEGMPTTTSRVHVLQRLKGTAAATLQVTQFGGTDPATGRLVLVRDDQLLRPGEVYLLALVRSHGSLVVVPVGGDRLLPGAATSSSPWLDYPAVAALHEAITAQQEDVLQLAAAPRR